MATTAVRKHPGDARRDLKCRWVECAQANYIEAPVFRSWSCEKVNRTVSLIREFLFTGAAMIRFDWLTESSHAKGFSLGRQSRLK